jgi:glutamate-1-semialdehyde 2,1-aminomutase
VEELANLGPDEDRKSSFHYVMLQQGAWPRNNPVFWKEIAAVADQIRYIEFTGGEPFLIREHFELLSSLVSAGLAQNIEIHYNTNGTQFPVDAQSIWQYFKLVEIAVSIDDVGTRFEYQRTNAIWAEVTANIERFKELRRNHSNIRLQFCSTVNAFNVYYLKELADFVYAQDFDFVYWNMLHEPYYYSIATLPESAKQAVAEHLRSAMVTDNIRKEFEQIIEFMMRGASLDGFNLRRELANLDRRRGQNLAHVEPEFAGLIGYTGP